MGLLDIFRREKAAQAISGGSLYAGVPSSSRGNDHEAPLRAYGENVWLYATVSRTSEAVAETVWTLYKKTKNGEREAILDDSHPLKVLLNKPNQSESGHDLLALNQTYIELCAKSYMIYQNNELHIAPSPWMKPITDRIGNVTSYVFKRGTFEMTFAPEEVIPFIHPDPLSPLDGVGWVQSAGIILDMQSYAEQTNRNLYYNGAQPGIIVGLEGRPPQDVVDAMINKFEARHRGYGAAHRMSVISGATSITPEAGVRDMEFENELRMCRDMILGAAGMPPSMLGVTENANKAVVETADYTFSRWVLRPRLSFLRRKFNEFLVPRFGDDLELDFDDPTPQNADQTLKKATTCYTSGIMTLNEARAELDLDPDPDDERGNSYIPTPSAPIMSMAPPIMDQPKSIKKKGLIATDEQKDVYWRSYVRDLEGHEKASMDALRVMWTIQKADTLKAFKLSPHAPIELSNKDYLVHMEAPMTATLLQAIRKGVQLIEPKVPHKDSPIPPVLSARALEWLKTRMGWAAAQIGDETAKQLASVIASGFESGASITDIAKNISGMFDGFSDARAFNIARTEVMQASNYGAVEGYAEMGVSKTEWLTARDDRTCETCAPMDGEIFETKDFPMPPASTHPGCRCVPLPVVE